MTLIGPLAIHLYLPVVPAIKTAFGVSDAVAEFSFSVTLATMGIATLFYGSLSDRFGRRPVLLSGLALGAQNKLIAARALLERHNLTNWRDAMRSFPAGWERRFWLDERLDAIMGRVRPLRARGPAIKPAAAKALPKSRPPTRPSAPPPAAAGH